MNDPPPEGEVAGGVAPDGGVSSYREGDTPPPRAFGARHLPLQGRIVDTIQSKADKA